ncbi:nitroreductase family protein [Candidatus Neptunichlamydia sp. REUL1]|uniref:nitroreductase family protein n=1 Tax=Candidatus Neptunichlamydia sp. REUL1 TaxID=3064277 RepID=UPI00292D42FA|nr:nitroreductase family protein [Candidatus Neptunochlamydia sp. REUL1]
MRQPDYPIEPLILNRWSPRAMSGEPLSDDELFPLFEAARWAPSSHNAQPWRFIYAKRETGAWRALFKLLVPFNQSWVANASVLVVIASHTVFESSGKPSLTHSFDTGAAWGNLALEGAARNLVVHGMQGFDYKKAKCVCELHHDYAIEAMIAIGKPGKTEDLPQDIQGKETPSSRKPLKELIINLNKKS